MNSGISTGTLLWTWELGNDAVRKLDLKIPESGGKFPDFLAEIRWNLDWMLSLQDSDSGVRHKQTSENFCRGNSEYLAEAERIILPAHGQLMFGSEQRQSLSRVYEIGSILFLRPG